MRPFSLLSERRKLLLQLAIAGGGGSSSTTELTVTGISPLALVNAVSSDLISLTRKGKAIQNGTPSEGITFNNGVLQAVDDELPIGYKRLIGIDFDGSTWYETGEAMTGDDDVTITFDSTISSGQNVFGSYNGTANDKKNFSLYIYGGSATNGSYFRYGDQLKRPVYGGGRRTVTFGKNGTQGFETDMDVTPDEFETPANTFIGMLPNSSSPKYTGNIIGSIYVGTRLEWIPCESPTGVIGYYERVNGNFIEPTGNGAPESLGYDTSHLVLQVVGTPEVLTAGNQTASVANLFAVGDVKDEHNIVSGTVIRRTEAVISDGTTPSTQYIGTVGDGNVIIKVRSTALTEHVAPKSIVLVDGTNTITSSSVVSGAEMIAVYSGNAN